MSFEYAVEKLGVAVDKLATNKGRIKERLQDAAIPALLQIRSEDLGARAREFFDPALRELTKVKAKEREGDFAASIAGMSEDEAQKVAIRLLGAYLVMRRLEQPPSTRFP